MNSNVKYPVYIHTEKGIDGYGVVVPDLLGCVSHGDSVEDAFRMVCEAVQLHLEGMIEDHDEVPTPREIEEIVATDDLADYEGGQGFWAFVEVQIPLEVAA